MNHRSLLNKTANSIIKLIENDGATSNVEAPLSPLPTDSKHPKLLKATAIKPLMNLTTSILETWKGRRKQDHDMDKGTKGSQLRNGIIIIHSDKNSFHHSIFCCSWPPSLEDKFMDQEKRETGRKQLNIHFEFHQAKVKIEWKWQWTGGNTFSFAEVTGQEKLKGRTIIWRERSVLRTIVQVQSQHKQPNCEPPSLPIFSRLQKTVKKACIQNTNRKENNRFRR